MERGREIERWREGDGEREMERGREIERERGGGNRDKVAQHNFNLDQSTLMFNKLQRRYKMYWHN
jgi:hypothetical protein